MKTKYFSFFFLSSKGHNSVKIHRTWTKFKLELYFLVINLHFKKYQFYIYASLQKIEGGNWEFFIFFEVQEAQVCLKIIGPKLYNWTQPVYISMTHPYMTHEIYVCNGCWDNDWKVNFPFFSKFKGHNSAKNHKLNLYIHKPHPYIKFELNVCNACWEMIWWSAISCQGQTKFLKWFFF